MAFTKIQNSDLNGKGVIGLADIPQLSTTAMQEKFEETARSVIVPKFNNLVDELEANTGASSIGSTNGTVQSELNAHLQRFASDEFYIQELQSYAHSHSNKAIIDKFGENSSGSPTYNNVPITGDSFSHVKVGNTTLNSSGEDTLEFVAGSNVTLNVNSAQKQITINAAGGGTSTGDMLKSEFVLPGGTGQVLSAKDADHATSSDSATHATNSDNATHATSADSATSATKVGNATTSVLEKFTEVNNALLYDSKSISNRLIKDRNFLFVGDSYCDPNCEAKTINKLQVMLGLADANCHNVAVAENGFLGWRPSQGGNNLFNLQLEGYEANNQEARNAITDIIVVGGLNDSVSESAYFNVTRLTTNMTDFINYAHQNYPNARVALAYVGNAVDTSADIKGRTYEYRQNCRYYYNKIGAELGYEIFHNTDLPLCISTAYMSSADWVHPSGTVGAYELARALAENILTGSCDVIYNHASILNASDLVSAGVKAPCKIDNRITTITFNDFKKVFVKDTELTSEIELSTMPLFLNKKVCKNVVVQLDVFTGGDNATVNYRQLVDGTLVLEGNSLKVILNSLYNGDIRSTYKVGSPYNGTLHIKDCEISYPTDYMA